MVGMSFEFEGDVQLGRALSRFENAVVNLQPFFTQTATFLETSVGKQFSSQGGRTGGWAPLSPSYAAWKAVNFPGAPLMVATGALRASLSGRSSDSIREVRRDQLKWGTRVGYAGVHQRGSGNMPQRRVVDLVNDDRRDIMKSLHRRVISEIKRGG